MDWGLARVKSAQVRTTRGPLANVQTGVVGTPGYMSPEAAQGRGAQYDERTDVFGLGAILYHVVTGEIPYVGEGVDLQIAAARGEIRPPQDALAGVGVSGRILRVITRALSKDRDDRYASASALKADLQRCLRGGLHMPRCAYAAGETIVTEGEIGEAAYVIVRGTCEAFTTVDDERRVLRRMGPGDVFGETSILSAMPRTASVVAVDTVTVLVVDRASLEEELGPNSWLSALVKALAVRFWELDSSLHRRG
jgi:serine/threonine-protein kinase